MMEELRTSIETEAHGDVTVVSLVGEHDLASAKAVRAQLGLSAQSGGGLVVSLARTEFFDSGVVNELFNAHGQLLERDRQLVLHVATPSIVRRMLDVSGLAATVACSHSLDEAIALAAGPPTGTPAPERSE
jgi:anti-anti-sigma factor